MSSPYPVALLSVILKIAAREVDFWDRACNLGAAGNCRRHGRCVAQRGAPLGSFRTPSIARCMRQERALQYYGSPYIHAARRADITHEELLPVEAIGKSAQRRVCASQPSARYATATPASPKYSEQP